MDFAAARSRMVERHLVGRGIADPYVLDAMRRVPREEFVADELREFAYRDGPLQIGGGQTISQPYIVALMIEAAELRPGDRVLEIGCGSGYAAAVMAEIASSVVTIERHRSLADEARSRLARLGYRTIEVLAGDGTLGLPDEAPFDVIVASAGGPEIPPDWKEQLAVGGRIVMPVGGQPRAQSLVKLTRLGERRFQEETIGDVWFVPLIGAHGWDENERRHSGDQPEAQGNKPAAAPLGRRTEAPMDAQTQHRITIEPFRGTVNVMFSDAMIASTKTALLLREEGHAPVFYVPFEDIYFDFLTRSNTTTLCSYKGTASYWSVQAVGEAAADVMWSYETPPAEFEAIRAHGAFASDRMRVEAVGHEDPLHTPHAP